MKKFYSTLLAVSALAVTVPAIAASNYNFEYSQNTTPVNSTILKGRVTTLPAGTVVNAHVSTPLSSATLVQGQPVYLTLSEDLYNNNVLIAEAGSSINGMVLAVTKAKHGSMNGSLNIRFTEIITRYGQRIPISASIKTTDGTGILKGGTGKDVAMAYSKDIAAGAASGALTGLIGAAISGGAKGKGTAIMTGVGAGAGLAKSVWDKGEDVNIPSNANIEIYFNQPVTVDSKNSYSYEY